MGAPSPPPLFGKDNLPADADPALGGHFWQDYRKATLTRALRIDGPFRVVTIHGGEPQECEGGYLALDSQGYPYPIDMMVFYETFRPAADGGGAGALLVPDPDGWRGEEPHEGTRRRLVRDTILGIYAEANSGRAEQAREEMAPFALEMADQIEEALLTASGPASAEQS